MWGNKSATPCYYSLSSPFNMKPNKDKKCTFGFPFSRLKNTSDFENSRGLRLARKDRIPGPNDYSPNSNL